MVKKAEELLKYLGNDDKKIFEVEADDFFQMLAALNAAVVEIDQLIGIIENTLLKNQEWRNKLGINPKLNQ